MSELCTICAKHEVSRHDIGGGASVQVCPEIRPGLMRFLDGGETVCNPEVVEHHNFDSVKADNDAWKAEQAKFGPQVGDIREMDGKRYEVKEVQWEWKGPFEGTCSVRLWLLDQLVNIEIVKVAPK